MVLAYGCQKDQKLGIKGESQLQGLYSARDVVSWYNSHPDYLDFKMDFKDVKSTLIVGNGNVSLDIARILFRQRHELEATDMSESALDSICQNSISNIIIASRRGPVQSSFSIKSIRELEQ